jgi:hypothetical protein
MARLPQQHGLYKHQAKVKPLLFRGSGHNRLAWARMGAEVPGLGLSLNLRGMLAKLWDS